MGQSSDLTGLQWDRMRPLLNSMGRDAILTDRNAIVWGRCAKAVGSYRIGRCIHRILCKRNGNVWGIICFPWERDAIVWCRYGAIVGSYKAA